MLAIVGNALSHLVPGSSGWFTHPKSCQCGCNEAKSIRFSTQNSLVNFDYRHDNEDKDYPCDKWGHCLSHGKQILCCPI